MKSKSSQIMWFCILYINTLSLLTTTAAHVVNVDTCSLADDSFFKETRGGHVKAHDKESTDIVDSYEECISLCHQRRCSSFNYYKTDSGEQRCDIFRFGLQSPNGRIFYKNIQERINISKSIHLERMSCQTNQRSKFIKRIHHAQFCDEIRKFGEIESGLYEVATSVPLYNSQQQQDDNDDDEDDDDDDDDDKEKKGGREFQRVSCEMDLLEGGWTVVQRNTDGFPTTYTWDDYKYGFGDLSADFWFGNEALYQLTKNKDTELLVQMEDENGGGKKYFNFFNKFWVADEQNLYQLSLGQAEQRHPPELESRQFKVHDGKKFSVSPNEGHAGWWYYGNYGANVFLNGNPDSTRKSKRIVWFDDNVFITFKSSAMYVRRRLKEDVFKKKKKENNGKDEWRRTKRKRVYKR